MVTELSHVWRHSGGLSLKCGSRSSVVIGACLAGAFARDGGPVRTEPTSSWSFEAFYPWRSLAGAEPRQKCRLDISTLGLRTRGREAYLAPAGEFSWTDPYGQRRVLLSRLIRAASTMNCWFALRKLRPTTAQRGSERLAADEALVEARYANPKMDSSKNATTMITPWA